MVTVYIFDGFYTVQEGDTLYFNKNYGKAGERIIFYTEIGKPVIGTILEASENSCSLGILMVDEKEEVTSSRVQTVDKIEEFKEEVVEETKEVVNEVVEEKIETSEENNQTIFDTMTKKELIAYIKDNNLSIETNKVNKTTLLEELKKTLV